MVFIDWSCGGDFPNCSLDASIKYAGNSSFKIYSPASSYYNTFTHNTFSNSQLQLIFWGYRGNAGANPIIRHSSYGDLYCTNSTNTTWERFRVTYWYDATTNTKWGRVERWSGSAWVQIGSDTNFGTGSPAAGSLILVGHSTTTLSYTWFDELEVYS